MVSAPLHVCRHPLVAHKMALLRDVSTPPVLFRTLVRDLTTLVFLEAVADLRLRDQRVQTPLAEHTGQRIAEGVGLMPILRAGLGRVEPLLHRMPEACVCH